ncbi:MAG: hypothetical protein ACYTGC_19965, partial [Planctomycetota bacterium]
MTTAEGSRHHRTRVGSVPLASAVLLIVSSVAAAQTAPPADDLRCLNCHGQAHIGELGPADRRLMVAAVGEPAADEPEARPALFVDYDRVYRSSVHANITCVSCHVDCVELPHAARTAPARCDQCHVREHAEYSESVHGNGNGAAASCSDCHGTHDMLSSRNPQSRTSRRQLPFTCAACHANTELMTDQGVGQPFAAQQYVESLHGHALLSHGLNVAPTCNDCHGVHDIRHAEDERSRIHRNHVPETCGRCHEGSREVYADSVHGRLLAAGSPDAPVCTTCHSSHEIIHPSAAAFKLQSDEKCGQCHGDRLARYRETFHGKAIALGLPGVAACYDCHGHHDILPHDDPASRLSSEHRLETCQTCHPRARANFAGYLAHADHLDRENYPVLFWTFIFMTSLVVGVFLFFGVHTVFWLGRVVSLYARDPKAFREQKAAMYRDREQFVRFRPIDRLLHGMLVTSFLLLVATGMPLKFYTAAWADWMVRLFGGLQVAGVLHRLAAIVMVIAFTAHLISMVRAGWRNRAKFRSPKTGRYSVMQFLRVLFGPDMPVPNLADVRDFRAHVKWFFGRGPRPQFDRWTYFEKFDYF